MCEPPSDIRLTSGGTNCPIVEALSQLIQNQGWDKYFLLKSRRLIELEATRCWNQYLVLSTLAALKASLRLKGRPRSSLSLLSEHLRVDPGVARGKNWTVGPRIWIRNSEDPIAGGRLS